MNSGVVAGEAIGGLAVLAILLLVLLLCIKRRAKTKSTGT